MIVLLLCAVAALAAVVVYLGWQQGPEHDLAGQVVLLTGAAGGLGRLLALSLAQRGCRLACVDVATAANEQTASMVCRSGRPHGAQPLAKAYTADLCSKEAIAALVQDVIRDFGQVDILVNSAGQLQAGRLWDGSDDQLDLLLDVNLRAVALLVRAVLPHMRDRGSGHIVTVSSMAAVNSSSHMALYAASKAGVSQLMECLYCDLHHEGLQKDIHVTTVQPFFIDTFADLTKGVTFKGVLRHLIPFIDAEAAARDISWSIATRQHVVFLPGRMAVIGNVLRHLPRVVQMFISDHLAVPDIKVFTYATPDRRAHLQSESAS